MSEQRHRQTSLFGDRSANRSDYKGDPAEHSHPFVALGVQRDDTNDALPQRGEVHALEEGLEAGVGAEGVEDKVCVQIGHQTGAVLGEEPSGGGARGGAGAVVRIAALEDALLNLDLGIRYVTEPDVQYLDHVVIDAETGLLVTDGPSGGR